FAAAATSNCRPSAHLHYCPAWALTAIGKLLQPHRAHRNSAQHSRRSAYDLVARSFSALYCCRRLLAERWTAGSATLRGSEQPVHKKRIAIAGAQQTQLSRCQLYWLAGRHLRLLLCADTLLYGLGRPLAAATNAYSHKAKDALEKMGFGWTVP